LALTVSVSRGRTEDVDDDSERTRSLTQSTTSSTLGSWLHALHPAYSAEYFVLHGLVADFELVDRLAITNNTRAICQTTCMTLSTFRQRLKTHLLTISLFPGLHSNSDGSIR